MDPSHPLQDTPDVSPAHAAAHVLLDALSVFESGVAPGSSVEAERDHTIALALSRLADVDAVQVTLTDGGRPHVDVTPLLRATLVLLTSGTTMLEAQSPGVDQLGVIARLRTVVDLTLTD